MISDQTDKKSKLLARREKIDARLAALKRQEKSEARKKDARRKIVIGGAILAHITGNPQAALLLGVTLDRHVTRPNDREAISDLLPSPGQPTVRLKAAKP